MRLFSCLPLSTLVLLFAGSADAETVERTVRGWTPSGDEVVVHVAQRGERMVEGASRDYYFELLEVYSAKDGELRQRFKGSAAVGNPPPAFEEAKTAELGKAFLASHALMEPSAGQWVSGDGNFRLVSVATSTVVEDEQRFRCRTRHRLALLDAKKRESRTLSEASYDGDAAARRGDAECVTVSATPAWSPTIMPNGQQSWVALVRAGATSRVYAGSALDTSTPAKPVTTSEPLLVTLVDAPELRAGYTALGRGAFDDAQRAFAAVTVSEGRLATALVEAFQGKKAAKKTADAAYGASDKTAWDTALRAATYVVAGDSKRAAKWIDEAIKAADGYAVLLKMASLYHLVDVGIANQLAVWALSHETAKAVDASAGWNLLARGLLDAGEFTKARESLEKVTTPDRTHGITSASHALDRGEMTRARDQVSSLIEHNVGDCEALALVGRIAAREADTAGARQLFEAAAFCDPTLETAAYYAADFARLSDDPGGAARGFRHYLTIAVPRRGDAIRDARRDAAKRWADRLSHSGVVLTQATCSPAAGATLCRGVLANTGAADVEAEVAVRAKKKTLASQRVPVAAGQSAPFGLRVEGTAKGAVITAGSSKKEQQLNETPVE